MALKRAYSFSQWHLDFALAFAAGVPLVASPTQARGALLAADNDEDDGLTEADFEALAKGQRERAQDNGSRERIAALSAQQTAIENGWRAP